ncbi:MAG: RNA methyltransferase [Cyanobacteriota bacterium]|nr:RNA methyltransferase [Cyanobacteriota bacterium]
MTNWERFAELRVVLVAPAGSHNLGSVARILKNMGLRQLILVNPLCHPTDPQARLMAVHAQDILQTTQIVTSLPAALADCRRVIGTTGRRENYPPEWKIEDPRLALPWLLGDMMGAVVFGAEDRGLSNQELALCHRQVMIPADPVYPSLNLAQAVAICCYELRMAALTGDLSKPDYFLSDSSGFSTESQRVPVQVLEDFYDHLKAILLKIGYLQSHTSDRKLSKFRALFSRAGLSLKEVAMLRGILRQLSWFHQIVNPENNDSPPHLNDSHIGSKDEIN